MQQTQIDPILQVVVWNITKRWHPHFANDKLQNTKSHYVKLCISKNQEM